MTRKVPLSDRKGSQPERVVSMRIIVIKPPPGVAMCLRSKDDEIVDRIIASGDDLAFDFAARTTSSTDVPANPRSQNNAVAQRSRSSRS